MSRKIYGIFVAGGSGTRMGGDIPKQFLSLGGVPVLERTIARFVEAVPDITVVTVLPPAHIRTWKEMCLTRSFFQPQIIIEGGITRYHSVRNALEAVPDGATVLVQDGVRPLGSVSLIRSIVERAGTCRAVIPAVPVTDTLKWKDGTLPDPDRSRLAAVQTPQAFRSEDLRQAYTQPYDPAFTDDASVVARKNIPLTLVEGERYNIKITVPEDIPLAEFIISACNP